MAYKNIQDQKDFHKKWYLKNKERLILKAKKNNKKYSDRNRLFVNNYKSERGCCDCGYNKNPVALDFDHIDDNKESNIAYLVNSAISIKKILKEINKCEVVCANCHRIRTKERYMAQLVDASVSKTE